MQKLVQIINSVIIKKSQYNSLIFLSLFIITSIISVTLFNLSRERVNLEYQNLLSNIYFKKSIDKLLSSTLPRYSNIKHTVQSGETLNSILSEYKISKEERINLIDIFSKFYTLWINYYIRFSKNRCILMEFIGELI